MEGVAKWSFQKQVSERTIMKFISLILRLTVKIVDLSLAIL